MAAARPSRYSTALLDSLVCPVLVDAKELQASLPAGVWLPPLPGIPEGSHPMIIEVWLLQNGLIEIAGATAHGFWTHAGGGAGLAFGGAAGAACGAWYGGAAGAALGMWMGPLGWWGGAMLGASVGAPLFARALAQEAAMQGMWAGRTASENECRTLGTYNEVIVTVPCRRVRAGGIEDDLLFVLGTFTDSAVSRLGEQFFGWGYRKSPAIGRQAADGSLEVMIGPGCEPVRIAARSAAQPETGDVLCDRGSPVQAAFSQPLLGMLPDNRLVVSLLERSFENKAVRVIPASVQLEFGDEFVPGVRAGRAGIQPFTKQNPWGAFLVTGLPVTLSFPCAAQE